MITFTPLKNFSSSETKSDYCVGMTYTIRPGNDKLLALAKKWQEEGVVIIGANVASVVKGE